MLSPHKSRSLLVLQEQDSCHREAPASPAQKGRAKSYNGRGKKERGVSRGEQKKRAVHEKICDIVRETGNSGTERYILAVSELTTD